MGYLELEEKIPNFIDYDKGDPCMCFMSDYRNHPCICPERQEITSS